MPSSADELDLMVISGEDRILVFFTLLVVTFSITHTFLTMSRSVIRPNGMPSLSSITTNELTSLSLIFFAVSWTEEDTLIASILLVIKSAIVALAIVVRSIHLLFKDSENLVVSFFLHGYTRR